MGPNERLDLTRRRREDESGAEMVEFALVVVLLVALVYGIVAIGLSLGAKVTITQAAADGARSGIVWSTPSTAISHAQNQALGDLSWLTGSVTCLSSTVSCQQTSGAACSSSVKVCINAYEPTATSTCATTCLKVVVTYNYGSNPLIPAAPGLNIITPSTISASSMLQVATPTS